MSSSTACVNCGFVDSGQFCSGCGAELSGGATKPILKAIGGPFFEYAHHAAVAIRPARLVEEVKEGRLRFAGALGFAAGAAALLVVVGWFARQAGGTLALPDLPFLAEPLLVLFAVTQLIFSAPAHWLLNLGGRSVTFRQFAITSLCIWALFTPWMFIGVAAAPGALGTIILLVGTLAYGVAAVRSYALLYSRSARSAFGYFMLGNLPLWLVSATSS